MKWSSAIRKFFRGAHAPRVLLAAPRRKLAPYAFTTLLVPSPPNPSARRRREHAGARVLPVTCKTLALAFACISAWVPFIAQSLGADSPSAQTNAQPTVILVVGAPGEDAYGDQFGQWAKAWEKICGEANAKRIALGSEKESGESDHDRLKKILDAEAKESLAELWLVLLGHGTFDGKDAKFNLRGPDLTASECAEWLHAFHRPLVVINCASASGPFLNALSGPGRVVITATRSGFEQNYAHFGEFLASAVADPAADLDKDGQVSVLEAFLTGSNRAGEFYKNEGRLATEHALLDDNGDGKGTPADWFRGIRATKKAVEGSSADGLRAHQIHLIRSRQELELPAEIRAQRDKLELEIAKLRDLKERIPADDYYRQLEPLMIGLALVYEKSGGKDAQK